MESSTAALKPTVTPLALAKRTTCSIGVPSVPMTAFDRDVTTYTPGAGSTLPGVTLKVRSTLSPARTSQTRSSSTEYTTRSPVPEPPGSAAGCFLSRGALVAVGDAAAACGLPRPAGTCADAW